MRQLATMTRCGSKHIGTTLEGPMTAVLSVLIKYSLTLRCEVELFDLVMGMSSGYNS